MDSVSANVILIQQMRQKYYTNKCHKYCVNKF